MRWTPESPGREGAAADGALPARAGGAAGSMPCAAVVLVALALVALGAGSAEAQDADALAARALFSEGVELTDAGRWDEAIDRFRRALALRDSAVIAYNLGIALSHEAHPVEAAERFRRVARDEAADPALRDDARRALAEAEAAIAWVEASWEGDASGLALHVDGAERPIALLGARMPLDPGEHRIALLRGHLEVALGNVTVAAGERATLALATLDVPTAEVVPVDEGEGDEAAARGAASGAGGADTGDDSGLWIGLGVGAGVLVVGGAIVLAVVLTPVPEAMPYSGSLGTVELGR